MFETNRRHQALTCTNMWYELNLSSIQVGGTGLAVLQATLSSGGGVPPDPKRGWMGIANGSVLSQGGPSHQREWVDKSLGDRPHEAQSAGLSCVGT